MSSTGGTLGGIVLTTNTRLTEQATGERGPHRDRRTHGGEADQERGRHVRQKTSGDLFLDKTARVDVGTASSCDKSARFTWPVRLDCKARR